MHVLRKLLFPVSLLYGLIVFLRNRCYDVGIFSSRSFATKTICVGNLSVGGTGKTPMIELLVSMLQHNYRIAILSRGYKRKSKGYVLATNQSKVEELGDEPFQLKAKFPLVSVAVDADRRNGITQLQKYVEPEVILLDDAFQHRKVNPDFLILLTAYGHLYVDDWYLPTGNLRDTKSEAKRAHLIVVTKCPKGISISEKDEIRSKIKPLPHQKVLFSFLEYDRNLKGSRVRLEELVNKKVTLVTGIANPEPLLVFLRNEGISFDHMNYGDHHFFTEQEFSILKEKECILTTEKDYVRLKNGLSALHYIEVTHKFLDGDRQLFEEAIEQFMTMNS